MVLECVLYFGLFLVLHFVVEHFRRKPLISDMSLKSIFITGCDSGFGNKFAKRLDGLGCRVFAACYTQKGADELRSCTSSRLETVLMDVSNTDSIKKAHQFVVDKLGPNKGLWGLVNNAGIVQVIDVPLEYRLRQDFQAVLDVNLLGLVDVTLQFLPLIAKTKGRIVNTSSAAGRVNAGVHVMPYHVSKHGVESFSDGLRPYMKRYGVNVAIIEPGLFATPITDEGPARIRIQRGYDRIPVEDQTLLGPDYVDKAVEIHKIRMSKSANPNVDEVVDAYFHALFGLNPKKRYSCGLKCRLFYIPFSYMPSWLQDYLTQGFIRKFVPSVQLSRLNI